MPQPALLLDTALGRARTVVHDEQGVKAGVMRGRKSVSAIIFLLRGTSVVRSSQPSFETWYAPMKLLRYVCPVHAEETLYFGNAPTEQQKMINRVEAVQECPQCKKRYCQWECVEVEDEPG